MSNLEKVKCVHRVVYRFHVDKFYYYKKCLKKHDGEDIFEIYDDYPNSKNYILVSEYAFKTYFKTKYQLRKEKISKLLNVVNI